MDSTRLLFNHRYHIIIIIIIITGIINEQQIPSIFATRQLQIMVVLAHHEISEANDRSFFFTFFFHHPPSPLIRNDEIDRPSVSPHNHSISEIPSRRFPSVILPSWVSIYIPIPNFPSRVGRIGGIFFWFVFLTFSVWSTRICG